MFIVLRPDVFLDAITRQREALFRETGNSRISGSRSHLVCLARVSQNACVPVSGMAAPVPGKACGGKLS
jgi:hypothetical protein